MNMKSLLPWLCVLGLLAGVGWLYSANRLLEAQVAALRQDSDTLRQLRTEAEQSPTNQATVSPEELTRLRKDNEELLRLRNELRQLRDDKQQLSRQVQTAQAQAQTAQAQAQALRTSATQPATPAAAPAMTPEQMKAFRDRYGLAPVAPEQANLNACINNLRQIDGAKQQWALERRKGAGALFTAADLAPYLQGNTLPTCPAGGAYTLNPVGISPICSIPTHVLPK